LSLEKKSKEEVIALLAQTEIFQGLGPDILEHLATRGNVRAFAKGDVIFTQGDPGEALFVLLDGVAKVVVVSERGDEMVLVTLEPPVTFGELALVDKRLRSASVEVLEPAQVLVVHHSIWDQLIEKHPGVKDDLLLTLVHVLRRLTDQTADFVFLDLHGRVAKLLHMFSQARGDELSPAKVLDLHMTQSDLATMVGGSRQSVNQILHSLEERGYLELRGRLIVLKRLDLLKRRAGL
jgi:CRP/FNR family transcriptional regulator, cyclic AMP receptor protein